MLLEEGFLGSSVCLSQSRFFHAQLQHRWLGGFTGVKEYCGGAFLLCLPYITCPFQDSFYSLLLQLKPHSPGVAVLYFTCVLL